MNMASEVEEVFIYMSRKKLIKVILNRLLNTCTVYGENGEVLMTLKNVSPMRLHEIRRQINDCIAKQRNAFGPRGFFT